jgi:hypothetical protein
LGPRQCCGVVVAAACVAVDADDMLPGTLRAARIRIVAVAAGVVERERCEWVLGKGRRCCCCCRERDQHNGIASPVAGVGDADGVVAAYGVAVVFADVGEEGEEGEGGGDNDGDRCCESEQRSIFLSCGRSVGDLGVVVAAAAAAVVVVVVVDVGENVLEGNRVVGTVSGCDDDDDDAAAAAVVVVVVVVVVVERKSGGCWRR